MSWFQLRQNSFSSSSWNSVVFWIYYENNIDNTTSRTSQFPSLCWWANAQEARREQLTRTGQRDVPYQRMSHSVCKQEGFGWASVSDWWAMVSCITCLSWVLFLFKLLLSSFSLCLTISILKLFLCQPMGFTFSPQSSSPSAQDGRDWDSSCIVLSCWLKLNHNTHK